MGYTRVYNLNSLMKKSLSKIVFVNDYETAIDLKAFFEEKNPDHISEINKNLLPYCKVGPFETKNKKSLFKLLCSTKKVKDIVRKHGAKAAESYVETKLGKMDLEGFIDCEPAAMNTLERLRASHLYDVFDGKFDFLMCDCVRERVEARENRIGSKRSYFTIAEYMRYTDLFGFAAYDLVWITDLSIDEMLELLGSSAKEYDYSFFTLDGTDVMELDKEKLLKGLVKVAETAKTAYAAAETTVSKKEASLPANAGAAYTEARKYDQYFRTALPQYFGKDDLKKAAELYESAARNGHPGAQLALGNLYLYGQGACAVDEEKALYWYIMAEFNENYDKNIPENIIKEVHFAAPNHIKNLVVQLPNGRELLRKYAGNRAEKLIKEAEHEAKIQKIAENSDTFDQEYLNKIIERVMGRES